MLAVNILSWVVVGLVLGAVWTRIVSDRHIKLPQTLIFAVCGALVGGFTFVGSSLPDKFDVTSLISSILGGIAFLFIDSLISHKKPAQPPVDQAASPR